MGKTARGKEKVKAKIAAAKKKIARKVKGSVAIMAAILSLVLYEGCSTATPASRATSASYEINVKVCMDENVKSATVNVPFTFGDGALASADSSGSTETQTATPTLDIKPDVNVNYAQGGGITNRGHRFIDRMIASYRHHSLIDQKYPAKFLPAELGERGEIIGAALLVP